MKNSVSLEETDLTTQIDKYTVKGEKLAIKPQERTGVKEIGLKQFALQMNFVA